MSRCDMCEFICGGSGGWVADVEALLALEPDEDVKLAIEAGGLP